MRQYALKIKQDSKIPAVFSKLCGIPVPKTTLLSGHQGNRNWAPTESDFQDIPIFTGMLPENLCEIALHFRVLWVREAKEERYFIHAADPGRSIQRGDPS